MPIASGLVGRRAFRPFLLTIVLIIAGLDLLLAAGVAVIGGTRAYVGGESLWAKGQKDAYAALLRYAETGDAADFARYERAMAIPLGDHRARLALLAPNLDWAEARDGFLQGGNHPSDVPLLILLVRLGGWEPHVRRAVSIWTEGDLDIERFVRVAQTIRQESAGGASNQPRKTVWLAKLNEINAHVTPLERAFSDVLGDAARQVQVALALAVAASSLALVIVGGTVARRLLDAVDRTTSELTENEARKSAMLDASLDAIVSMDATGRIVEFSRAAEAMFGHTREAVLGRELIQVIGPPELREGHRTGLTRYLASGESRMLGRRLEIEAVRADGSRFPVEATIARVASPGPALFTGFIRDITERRRQQEQLAQAQKMEVVGRLAGGVAHDFNNLLTAIMGFGEVLQHRLAQHEVSAPELIEILHAAERAKAVTSQLLAFSRKQMLRMAPIDLNGLIERDGRLIARLIGEHIRLSLALESSIGMVQADAAQVSQVVLNLAVNAADAMPDGGELRIQTSRIAAGEALPLGLDPGTWVRIRVADTGVGIERDVLPHIFEPFFTTKVVGKGSGLGLATVYGIVKQLGGEITVESEVGHGTRFDIYLRAEEGAASAAPGDGGLAPGARRPLGTEAILLVEDEHSVRDLVKQVLLRHGYRVTTATSAEEAQRLADPTLLPLDLLLTDAVMPGQSGPALASDLVKRYPGLRVLVMSGFSEHPMLTTGPQGMRLLPKPFRPDELLRVVREQLDA